MGLTVLGCSGTYPRPGEACNGFLLQESGLNVVLDFGNGCMSNLLKQVGFTQLAAVFISHMHVDHYLDLFPLFYALRFHPDQPWGLPLYAAPDALARLARMMGDDTAAYLGDVFDLRPVFPGAEFELGGMRFACYGGSHPVEANCLRIEGDGWTMAYSGDTAPAPGLEEAARGADLFICEATMIESYAANAIGHMTASGAGRAAAAAGAGKLMLTHIWPAFDRRVSLEEASAAISGPVELAAQDMTIELRRR
ncbi:MAG: MBL fold metallo-hydrolase [Candidatus Geothermincolia bacterium]